MGTLPLSSEQDSPPSLSYLFSKEKQWPLLSPISSPSTLWWLSTSPRRSGTNSPASCPRPPNSPWPRPLLAPLSSTTSTAASMLVTRTPTSTLLKSSTLSSANTMASVLTSSTPPTWTPAKSPATSRPMFPSTLAGSALDVPSKALVFPPESPSNNVSTLRPS